jgi:hypothetical protein
MFSTEVSVPGKAPRVKGHRFEREVSDLFKELYGEHVKRGFQTRDGSECPDVDGTPFWIECKKGKQTRPLAALQQAEEASDGRVCIAVCCNDRDAPTVTLRLYDFMSVLVLGKEMNDGNSS